MFFKNKELFPYAAKYADDLIHHSRTLDFKKCGIIFSNATEVQLESILLKLLDQPKYWLYWKSFNIACCNTMTNRLRPTWRENVKALSEMDAFNVETMALILSFLEPSELAD